MQVPQLYFSVQGIINKNLQTKQNPSNKQPKPKKSNPKYNKNNSARGGRRENKNPARMNQQGNQLFLNAVQKRPNTDRKRRETRLENISNLITD